MEQAPPLPPVPARPGKGLAVAALVLGICSFIPMLGVLCAIAAAVLGIVSLAHHSAGKRMAIAGLVLGVTALMIMPFLGLLVWYWEDIFGR